MKHPATVSLDRAAQLLGVSRATLARAAEDGTAPVPVLTTRSRRTVPIAPLAKALGMDPADITETLPPAA